MIKVTTLENTTKSEKFKKFLAQSFKIDMLYPVFNDKSGETLFDCWRGKDMLNWHRFIDDFDTKLEFYPTHYTIKKNGKDTIEYMLSIPETINDFINDMTRFGIELYWTEYIDLNFEPKDYLAIDEIRPYFEELLGLMGKSHELL